MLNKKNKVSTYIVINDLGTTIYNLFRYYLHQRLNLSLPTMASSISYACMGSIAKSEQEDIYFLHLDISCQQNTRTVFKNLKSDRKKMIIHRCSTHVFKKCGIRELPYCSTYTGISSKIIVQDRG